MSHSQRGGEGKGPAGVVQAAHGMGLRHGAEAAGGPPLLPFLRGRPGCSLPLCEEGTAHGFPLRVIMLPPNPPGGTSSLAPSHAGTQK